MTKAEQTMIAANKRIMNFPSLSLSRLLSSILTMRKFADSQSSTFASVHEIESEMANQKLLARLSLGSLTAINAVLIPSIL